MSGNTHIAAMLEALVASGQLTVEGGNVLYMGNPVGTVQPRGADQVHATDEFDEDGFSTAITEYGGRKIRQLEEYKQELINNGESKFASKIPTYHIVSPVGSRNLKQNDELLEAKAEEHNWPREAIVNADKNIARATFQAMGGHNVGYARDYLNDNQVLDDHRAYDVRTDTADEVVDLWKDIVEAWRNPSPFDNWS